MPVGSWSYSRGAMVGSQPARHHGPSRRVGYTQVCFFLILGIGSLLVFSYQSEIYVTLAGKDVFSSGRTPVVTSRPLRRTYKPEIKVERETSRSREQTPVFREELHRVPGNEQEWNVSSLDVGESVTQRKLESSDLSSPAPSVKPTVISSAPPSGSDNSSSSNTNSNRNSSSWTSPPLVVLSPRQNKNDKKKAVDLTNPDYVPLVENVHSNLISAKFRLVIKLLAVNSYGSLLRCLNSLHETDFAGDTVDLHIYIDHFIIDAAIEAQKRQRRRRRRLLAKTSGASRRVNESESDSADVVDIEAETVNDAEEEVSEDSDELESVSWDSPVVKAGKKADRIQRRKSRRKGKHSSSRKLGVDAAAEVQEEPRVPDKVDNYLEAVNPNDWGIIENKLRDLRRVLGLADRWVWKFGTKVVHYRSQAAGYQGQWIDSWWPSSDDEFALVVEDDMELSPLFYRYVRSIIATYYYQPAHYDPSLYGLSLQRPTLVPGKSGQPIKVDARTRLYMYEMVGIWGQVFFPKPWKEFRTWYDTHKSHDQKPILEGMVTTDWYREYGEKMWTPWFVKFVHTRGYFNMYTNFLKDRVMSVTHRSESPKTKKYAGCDSELIWSNSTYDIDIWHMAPLYTIKRYDYCFKEVKVWRFANKSTEISQVLSTVHNKKEVLMLSTLNVPEPLVRNWVCVLRKLGITNYVFFGEDLPLLQDLSRRGHPALHTEFSDRLTEDGEKEVNAVLTVLKLGYDVWFARADMIWVGNPLSLFDVSAADMIGSANPQLNMFYIRNTKETVDAWSSFYKQLDVATTNISRQLNMETAREAFVQRCDAEEKIRVQPLDKVLFLSAEKMSALPSEEGTVPDAQVVLFGEMKGWTSRDLGKKATQLNLWNLDDDLVCTRVIC